MLTLNMSSKNVPPYAGLLTVVTWTWPPDPAFVEDDAPDEATEDEDADAWEWDTVGVFATE